MAPSAEVLRAMRVAMEHRGPDGYGTYAKNDTALAQTRLAIIDLKTGDQPFYETGGAALVANGEIYNYLELRNTMPGTVFASQSDCEMPLHLYRRQGPAFVNALRGMYAIAIHDAPERRLLLARDPFGIKPLYYAETNQCFAFASEPRALIAGGFVKPRIRPQVLRELLQLQFTTGRDTIFDGIKRVNPGETLIISKGRIVERQVVSPLPHSAIIDIDEAEGCDHFDRIWADSVTVHQRSDVPYGMFFSGGIDSSAVLAMMARINQTPVKAFTLGFSGTNVTDERDHARHVAHALGAEHIEVEFSEGDFWRLLPSVARAMDDPAADYAILPTFKLAAAARAAGLKVILSGEGGDELFAGYGRYRRAMRPRWLGGRSLRAHGTFEELGVLRYDLSDWREGMQAAADAANQASKTRLQAAQATDCADWLPNDLLTKLDRCLMAHGIEGRTPFLDPVVASFAFCLPDHLKVNKGLGKWLLRSWLAKTAPVADAFSRKRGFTVPVGEWISRRSRQLGELVAAQDCVNDICHSDVVIDLFNAATEKRAGFAAWVLLFYALWHQHHIEGRALPEDVFAALENGI